MTRKPSERTLAVAVMALAFASCSAQRPAAPPPQPVPAPLYAGQPLDYWMQQLQNPDAKARVGAATALGRLGPHAAPAVPLLIDALKDQDKLVRTQSIAALGKIGPAAAGAIPELTQLSKENDWATRNLATSALAAIEQKPMPTDSEREKMPSRATARHAAPPPS